MFERKFVKSTGSVTIIFEGQSLEVPAGETVAGALCISNMGFTRKTIVSGSKRSAYCMMGACFECLMIIDGQYDKQACMIIVEDGMVIKRQNGANDIAPVEGS